MHKRALMVTTVPVTLQAFLLPLVDALRDNGWVVDALTGRSNDAVMMGDEGVLQQHFNEVFQIGWYRSAMSFLRIGSLAREIAELVAVGDYDVVHVHTPIASFITRFALRNMPIEARPRIIYTAHGFHFLDEPDPPLSSHFYRGIEQYSMHVTDDLVVMNDMDEYTARNLVSYTKKNARPTTLHRIDGTGIDFGLFSASHPDADEKARRRAELGIPIDAVLVGMVAEMNENKRHRLLIEAARRLTDHKPAIHYLLIGSGPLKDVLIEKTVAFDLAPYVHFTGQLSYKQVRELIPLCDLGILVSRREGLPRSLMEFIASHVAVIGTTTRGITDIVYEKDALCEPNAVALADLIRHYAHNPALREALASDQYAYARAHYDTSVVVPQYLKLYRPIRAGIRVAAEQPQYSVYRARSRAPSATRSHAVPRDSRARSERG